MNRLVATAAAAAAAAAWALSLSPPLSVVGAVVPSVSAFSPPLPRTRAFPTGSSTAPRPRRRRSATASPAPPLATVSPVESGGGVASPPDGQEGGSRSDDGGGPSESLRVGFSSHIRNIVRSGRGGPRRSRGGGRPSRGAADAARRADEELGRMERLWYGTGGAPGPGGAAAGDVDRHDPREDESSLLWSGPLVRPDVYCYAAVADAYAKAGMGREGAERAEGALGRLEAIWEAGDGGAGGSGSAGGADDARLRPNPVLYTSVINAWNRCGDGRRAEAVLRRMEGAHARSGRDPAVAPDVVAYTSVIDAWANAAPSRGNGRKGGGGGGGGPVERAEAVLRRMEESSSSGENPGARPNAYTYTALMKLYSHHVPGADGAERAESLLRRMDELYRRTGDDGVRPNAYSYTNAMNAWSKAGAGIEGARRAERLLREMEVLYRRTGDESLRPTARPCTCVVDAYARSGAGREAADRAVYLLGEMEGGEMGYGARPNARTYTAAITAVSRSGGPDAAGRARELLGRMDGPDSRAYACVIHALAKSGEGGSAREADELLGTLLRLSREGRGAREWGRRRGGGGPGVDPPDEATHAAVIHAYLKSDDPEERAAAPDRCTALLRQLVELRRSGLRTASRPRSEVDVWLFNDVLHSWAASGRAEAPLRCEELLETMEELGDGGRGRWESAGPNCVSYTFAIDAWVNSGSEEASKKAQELLRRCESRNELHPNQCAPPNARAVSAALEAALRGGPGSSRDAEELLLRAVQLNLDGDRSYVPTARSFARVMTATLKRRGGDTTRRIVELFRYMRDASHLPGNEALKPNTVCYNIVINALAKSRERGSAAKAEELLRSMIDKHEGGDEDVKPDVITYSAVISAWAGNPERGAAQKAEEHLRHLWGLYEAGDESMKPNSVVLNNVVCALANSRGRRSADRAEELLADMERRYRETGDASMKPEIKTYTSVVHAYANSRASGSAAKAEKMLRHAERAAKPSLEGGGQRSFLPDVVLYGAVINCYAKSKEEGSAQKAEDLLDRMMKFYEGGGREGLKPNAKIVGTVIHGWAISSDILKAEKAQKLLRRMKEMHAAGNDDLKPDVFAYTWLIYAAATSFGDEDEKKHDFAIALDAFQEVHRVAASEREAGVGDGAIRPDSYVYSFFVKACHRLLPPGEERDNLIGGAFDLCCRNGMANKHVLSVMMKALPERVRERFGQMGRDNVVFDDIPPEWCRNAKGRQPSGIDAL